jgi:hypothetical protein
MASLMDLYDPYEAAAARTRRRYPVREADPASLAASQGRAAGVEKEKTDKVQIGGKKYESK